MLASILVFLSTGIITQSYAISDGDTISFTAKKQTHAWYFSTSDDTAMKGTCCVCGDEASSSGTATVYKLANTDERAKAAYYMYAYMWDNTESYNDNWQNVTYKRVGTHFCQIANQGAATWKKKAKDHLDYTDNMVDTIVSDYNTAMASTVVPDDFEVFICVPSDSSQSFLIWKLAPKGNLKISKTLSKGTTSEAFTFTVTVAGAEGTYSGVTFTGGVATVSLHGGQSITIEGLPAGAAYSVVETGTPDKWKLEAVSGDTGTIGDGTTVTASFTNRIKTGYVSVKKQSGNTDITG